MDTYYSDTYYEARRKFTNNLRNAKKVDRMVLKEIGRGKDNEELSIDVAIYGNDKNPKEVLIYSSGVHGVEGFAGSAAQLMLVEALEKFNKTLDDIAIVIIHCVNPYGMSFGRRTNMNNVDLNRNFFIEEFIDVKIKKSQYIERGTNNAYFLSNELINPKYQEIGFLDCCSFYLKYFSNFLFHGYNSFTREISEGQSAYPKGLFYGGRELEQEPNLVLNYLKIFYESIDPSNLKKITHIDLHTGYGKPCETVILANDDTGNIIQVFGEMAHTIRKTSCSLKDELNPIVIKGRFVDAVKDLFMELNKNLEIVCLTQETGTVPFPKILRALRIENAEWFYNQCKSSDCSKDKFCCEWNKELDQLFNPKCETWRKKHLINSSMIISKIIKGLDFENIENLK